jgi:hypothetical protein
MVTCGLAVVTVPADVVAEAAHDDLVSGDDLTAGAFQMAQVNRDWKH